MILVILLVCAALSGCAKPKQIETQGPKQPTTLESIGRMDEIAIALGCMFNPSACKKEKVEEKKETEIERRIKEYKAEMSKFDQ